MPGLRSLALTLPALAVFGIGGGLLILTPPHLEPLLPVSTAEMSANDVQRGRNVYMINCAACHGVHGQGVPRQGSPLVGSQFLGQIDDPALIHFLKVGRSADAPDSVMGLPMPPRAGNPWLSDEDLVVVSGFLRHLQLQGATQTHQGK